MLTRLVVVILPIVLCMCLSFVSLQSKAAPVPLSERKKAHMKLTHPDIERLATLFPPPDEIREPGTPEQWAKLESRMGTALPDDLKAFYAKYGHVIFSDSFYLISPILENPSYTEEYPETKGLMCLEQHLVICRKSVQKSRLILTPRKYFGIGDPKEDPFGDDPTFLQRDVWPGEDTIMLIGSFMHARCTFAYRVKGPPNEWTILAGNQNSVFKEYPMGLGKWLQLMIEHPEEADNFGTAFPKGHPFLGVRSP